MFNARAMIQQLCSSNPNAARAWEAAQKMVAGKSQDQRIETAKNLAKEKGVSYEELKEMAKNYGINLP